MRLLALLLLALAGPASAAGTEPRLAVFVTDQDADVHVALYGQAALELAGCASAAAARELLALPAAAPVEETTLGALQAEAEFGSHPRLPCEGAAFDADWAATAAIWADVEGSGNYFLPAPSGQGFYALPSGCLELKRTLAIRERLQLPGVLQGMTPPPEGAPVVQLGCGPGADAGEAPPPASAASGFSLHRFHTFLTPESTGDTIHVVRYAAPEGSEPAYLPILRLDGTLTSAAILGGGAEAAGVEAALRGLFGIDPALPVTPLGAEAVSGVRAAVHADLCLSACDGYPHASGAFLQPGLDLGLTAPVTLAAATGLDPTGAERLVWTYAEGRSLAFTGCPALVRALGLAAAPLGEWMAEAGAALAPGVAGPGLDCRAAAADVCLRTLAEGEPLLPATLALGDCAPGGALRVELPATVAVPQGVVLAGSPFASVELRPTPGTLRSRLIVTPTGEESGGACILSGIETLIGARDLPRLVLTRIDLAGAGGAGGAEVVALAVERGSVALDGVTIGTGGEGLGTVARGVSLCLADLYGRGLRVEAEALALQGVGARVLIGGTTAERASLGRGRFGVLLSSGSLMRLAFVDVTSDTGVVLRGATVAGAGVALAPASTGVAAGAGLQVERGSSVELTTSTIAGFRCAASLLDAASSVTLLLPGNDVAASNTHTGCGAGRFSLIE